VLQDADCCSTWAGGGRSLGKWTRSFGKSTRSSGAPVVVGWRRPRGGLASCCSRQCLRSFAVTGHAPDLADMETAAAPVRHDGRPGVGGVAAQDFLTLTPTGGSWRPTRSRGAHRPHRADRGRTAGVVDVRDRRTGHPGHARPRRHDHLEGLRRPATRSRSGSTTASPSGSRIQPWSTTAQPASTAQLPRRAADT